MEPHQARIAAGLVPGELGPGWNGRKGWLGQHPLHGSSGNHPIHASHLGHSFNMWPMWGLLTMWQCGSIAGSVGAGRPGNAGLPTGARPVPAHPCAGPGSPASPAGR